MKNLRVKLAFSELTCHYMGCSSETDGVNSILAVI